MRFGVLVAASVVLALGACAEDKPVLLPVMDPGQSFLDELETRMLRAKSVHVQASAQSTGAVNSELAIELFLGEGQRARLEVKGTFEGRPASTWFICDGDQMKVRGKPSEKAAPEVRDAVVVGMVRMGLLHNAALLIGGRGPDHASGGVRDFVRAERAKSGTPATDITYDVVIRHDVMGQATLSLSPEAKPVKRTAEIHFEEGDMTVLEKYDTVELDAAVDDSVFSLAP